jgi:hypothetical protein
VTSDGPATAVYANYFDAAESDLSAPPASVPRPAPPAVVAMGAVPVSIRPIALPLVILALLALIGESILLARRAVRWRGAHV